MSAPQLTVYQNGPIAISGDQLNTFVQGAQTANQLRTLTGVSGMSIMLQGITTPGDGGAGFFYWNSAATASDDNLNTIVPDGTVPGAWLRDGIGGGGGGGQPGGTNGQIQYNNNGTFGGLDVGNGLAIIAGALVATGGTGGGVTSVVGSTGAVALSDLVAGGVAPLLSPNLIGNPTAPTPPATDNDTSIATTAYVTAKVAAASSGLVPEAPVRLVATANVSLSGLAAIDGVTPVAGDRILVVGQTTSTQNGSYVAASGAWARTSPSEAVAGALWLVTAGATEAGSQWIMSTTGTITVGTTPISIVQFGAPGSSTYIAPYGGSVSRTITSKLGDFVSVKDFGAAGNGTTDDTAAINAALASGAPAVILPAGTYKTSGTLTLTTSNQKLIGAGRDATVIQVNSTTAVGITVSAFMQSFTIQGLSVTRVGTPVANASGINASASCSQSLISDVNVQGHWVGIALGTTDYSTMENCFAQKNLSHGVFLQNATAGGAMQWYLINVISQENAGSGFFVQATAAHGAGQLSVGTWTNCATFGNSGTGASFIGTSTCPVQGVRILGGFYGADGSDELAFDTFGSQNVIRDVFLEIAGTGTTGPTLSTPATHVGNGISTTANTLDISVEGCHINQMSQNGMFLLSGTNRVVGGEINNNGLAGTSGAQNGIALGTGSLSAIGVQIGNTGGNTIQVCGINSTGNGSQLTMVGNDFTGNNPNAFLIATNSGGATAIGNSPVQVNSVLPSAGLVVGPATGGVQGAGTINVSGGYYLNGSAISGGGSSGVSSFNSRTGAVTLASLDVTGALGYTPVSSFNSRSGAVTLTNADVAATVVTTPLFCGNGSGISGPGSQGVLMGSDGMNLNMSDTGTLAQFFWSTSGTEFNWSYNNRPIAQLGITGVLALGAGLSGTIAGNNAISGVVGEYISATVPLGSAVTLTTNVARNVASIVLSAGDWDVWGTVATAPSASTTQSNVAGGLSTTSGTLPTFPGNGAAVELPILTTAGGVNITTPVGQMRVNITAATTVYLVGLVGFATSTCGMYGFIGARRVR